jgi:hypothetical protein
MAMRARHKKLFTAYVRDLKDALKLAKREPPRKLPRAAHPRVLGVVIEYFFRCQTLNEELEEDEVEPADFVFDMLTGQHEALYEALAELPYLPHGLDQDDAWV